VVITSARNDSPFLRETNYESNPYPVGVSGAGGLLSLRLNTSINFKRPKFEVIHPVFNIEVLIGG
jgi:hypothetical protein